ncbi:hypothetical protein [Vibrio methylphosphonaticus]|uniref:hypothetical protein n=1 Tax=Vibrio methylphosphonaticus TaxID=2946866 RepID=UPI00202A6471|nr:hypothetical protein [Vibrio methylphosphonaticus]MCL9773924.1 hypothetical protein [Vibrio methylphosphonaticus]
MKKLIILMLFLPSLSIAETLEVRTVHASLDSWFSNDHYRFCKYKNADVIFYVVHKHNIECEAEATGDIQPPKKVKKPSLKVPRTWKQVQ